MTAHAEFSVSNTSEEKVSKRGVFKNVIAISLSFTFLFTSFQGISNLQSSINADEDLGVQSLTTVYVSLIVSCLFLPSLVLKKLTCKWTMVVSVLCYSSYIAAQFYPRRYTLLPGAILVGLGAAPLWSAKCTYLTQLGNYLSRHLGEAAEPLISRFFGIFFLFFQSSQIFGNLIAYLVLHPGQSADNQNETDAMTCGYNFCPSDKANNTNIQNVSEEKKNMLIGVYLAVALLASALLAILVDSLVSYGEKERENHSEHSSPLSLLIATVVHLKNPYQLLIIPLTIWSGLEQGFLASDFTQAYVTCSIGVHSVGLVLIAFGACDAIGSISFGFVIKKVGRLPIFILGALLNIAAITALASWTPTDSAIYVYFLIAAVWGLADSIWQTQINSFYGVIFPNKAEAAFSNYRLWESLGFVISFVISGKTCVYTKIQLISSVLALGMIGYFIIELLEWRKKK